MSDELRAVAPELAALLTVAQALWGGVVTASQRRTLASGDDAAVWSVVAELSKPESTKGQTMLTLRRELDWITFSLVEPSDEEVSLAANRDDAWEKAEEHLPEDLRIELQDAATAYFDAAMERAFVCGWLAAKEPERLIF